MTAAPKCNDCPHKIVVLCNETRDFCIGKGLAESLLRLGHDIATTHYIVPGPEFDRYVLALDRLKPGLDPIQLELANVAAAALARGGAT